MSFLENAKGNDAFSHVFLTHATSISQGRVPVHPGHVTGWQIPVLDVRAGLCGQHTPGLTSPWGYSANSPFELGLEKDSKHLS